MAAEAGHAANRVYISQDGNLHLNGASIFDASENDITSQVDLNGLTSTVAELNQLHSSGVVTADLSNLHSVTATAAEINVLHSVTAGTTSASSALVVDATKNLDALAVTALSLGASGGTAVTSTATEINQLHSQGAVAADFAKLHGITAAAATLNQVAAAAGTVNFDRSTKVAKVALAAVDTGGGIFSWTNPEAGSILITNCLIDVTTVASGACTIDVGTTAASGTTQSDTLIDGLDVHAATGVFNQSDQAGANGKTRQKLASGAWVTGSKDTGGSAALVGNAYIFYINV